MFKDILSPSLYFTSFELYIHTHTYLCVCVHTRVCVCVRAYLLPCPAPHHPVPWENLTIIIRSSLEDIAYQKLIVIT